jgi:hypothetical protein
LKCLKCNGRMFIDRQYTTIDHIETFCMICGTRNFYHPPSSSSEGTWLLTQERLRAKNTMMPL